jgi:hypothetical protein
MLLQVFLFFILIVGPILLAWLKGDALLNYFELRRQLKHQRRRQRSTRALPVRETIMGTLLQVETRRDDLEKVVLARESLFDDYLDTACLQSDTIETITQEVVLLREAAELDRNVSAQPTGAALHLLETLQQAEQKRVQIDQRLHRLGRA